MKFKDIVTSNWFLNVRYAVGILAIIILTCDHINTDKVMSDTEKKGQLIFAGLALIFKLYIPKYKKKLPLKYGEVLDLDLMALAAKPAIWPIWYFFAYIAYMGIVTVSAGCWFIFDPKKKGSAEVEEAAGQEMA